MKVLPCLLRTGFSWTCWRSGRGVGGRGGAVNDGRRELTEHDVRPAAGCAGQPLDQPVGQPEEAWWGGLNALHPVPEPGRPTGAEAKVRGLLLLPIVVHSPPRRSAPPRDDQVGLAMGPAAC